MKKRQSSLFKKVLLTFMVSILTLFMSGCSSSINQMSIEKVCKALEEKYGEEFEVTIKDKEKDILLIYFGLIMI